MTEKIKRGLFIVIEGLDRCGKTSQCTQLMEYIEKKGKDVVVKRFPDRTTVIGSMISAYLQGTQHLSDQAIHLLFSANRWEAQEQFINILQSGTSIICDRYSYSGVAYSAAKGLDVNWCKLCDRGLIRPDVILYLHAPEKVIKARTGFGDEIYEREEFQTKVKEQYNNLFTTEQRVIFVEAVKPQEEVAKDIQRVIDEYLVSGYHLETLSKLEFQ